MEIHPPRGADVCPPLCNTHIDIVNAYQHVWQDRDLDNLTRRNLLDCMPHFEVLLQQHGLEALNT